MSEPVMVLFVFILNIIYYTELYMLYFIGFPAQRLTGYHIKKSVLL